MATATDSDSIDGQLANKHAEYIHHQVAEWAMLVMAGVFATGMYLAGTLGTTADVLVLGAGALTMMGLRRATNHRGYCHAAANAVIGRLTGNEISQTTEDIRGDLGWQ